MKTVLVTGGAGFIGSHTVVELIKAGYHPVIVDNFSNSDKDVIKRLGKLLGQPVACYDQDYQDTAKLKAVMDKENPDSIIHFAAYKAVAESLDKPLNYYRNNVSGLIALLEFLEDSGLVKHFVFSSSCTVYGEPKQLPITETAPLQPPASPYGATKQMAETILRDTTKVSKRFNSISLRYFNPIGAHPSALIGELPIGIPANLVPFVTQVAAGLREKLIVNGDNYPTPDGSCIRDYIHVVDLAKAHIQAMKYLEEQPVAFYDTVNIGTGTGTSVLEVLKTFNRVTGQKVRYEIGARRKGDVTATYASGKKAFDVLGWKPEKTLDDALADAWRWQKQLK
jgi:UDP-glucose 4-epimerase